MHRVFPVCEWLKRVPVVCFQVIKNLGLNCIGKMYINSKFDFECNPQLNKSSYLRVLHRFIVSAKNLTKFLVWAI